jgi:uncharacterized coiled-coil protein SlyX
MSFYTYYGKLKEELFVAVLPNGTVELDDPVHLYSQKRLITYQVRDVDVTEDGEDRFIFQDGYYTFEATTAKAYKTISLIRTCRSGGEVATVALTRHYEQPQTATSASSRPKIWTGAIDFHDWAKNESFIVIAPQGLGNAKDVVAMWQWTKDNKGVAKTLSYGVSKQTSDAKTPEKFTFKQNEYYTLDCQVNATTKGLNVTVKGPTNAAKAQKELVLAPQTEGAEHRFAPPQARQEQRSFECSLPNAKPSLPRITAALPFPADLVETLSYSAAYVDQAGYLAKYAVKQFEKLDRSYHLLEKKAEARALKISKLDEDVNRLTAEGQRLTQHNAELEKQAEKDRKEAANQKADLEEKLRKALAALKASEKKNEKLAKKNAKLEKHIAKDLLEDLAREAEHAEHEREDHEEIDIANEALKEAQALGERLQKELTSKNSTIIELQASLDATKSQLDGAKAEILRLNSALTVEKKQKAELQKKFDEVSHKLFVAEQDLAHMRVELSNTKAELASEHKKNVQLEEHVASDHKKIEELEDHVASDHKKIAHLEEHVASDHKKIEELKAHTASDHKKIDDLKEHVASDHKKIEGLEAHMAADHKKIADLKESLAVQQQKVEQLEAHVASDHKKIEELKEHTASDHKKMEDLKEHVASDHKKIEGLEAHMAADHKKIANLKESLAVQEKKVQQLELELKQVKTDLVEEKKNSAFLTEQNEDDRKAHQMAVNGLNASIKEKAEKITQLKLDIEGLRKARKEMKESLDQETELREKAEKRLDDLEAKEQPDSDLQSKFNDLQTRYDALRKHDGDQHHKIGVTVHAVELTTPTK